METSVPSTSSSTAPGPQSARRYRTSVRWRAAMDDKYFPYFKNIGNGGKVATPTHLAGGAANAALMLATVDLANAYAGRGVRIVGLTLGLTQTGRINE